MCTCGQNHASLWAVSPVNSSGYGCASANSSMTSMSTRCGGCATASNCGCYSDGAATTNSGCFGRCSSCGGYNAYTNQTANTFIASRVNGCCGCPFARNGCGCQRNGCSW